MKTWMMLAMIALMALPMAADACPGKGHGGKGSHFKMMDTNNDGTVSAEEHAAHAAERFKKLDANGDGKVTAEEHEKVRAQMHEKYAGMGHGHHKECPADHKNCPLDHKDCPKEHKNCPMDKKSCPIDGEKKGDKK